ncbi:hypothetical protein [Methylobacterium sp. J-090]|uniref:hypothetical protein n=1 Tax=Methylobacterium sp. J-090 TaxID=2836666 RepID=UPI001FB8CB30|nr:hypothetical protein [Methylobacterium sp. J-090]MCJ2080162.1 hypothetical protein [Methylobacterium sp. J-090]
MRRPSASPLPSLDTTPPLRERAAVLKDRAQRVVRNNDDSALPAPGSEDARARFRVACDEVDRVMRAVSAACDSSLRLADGTLWTRHGLEAALTSGEISVGEYARLYPLAADCEARIDAAARATNLHVLHALAFTDPTGPGIQA